MGAQEIDTTMIDSIDVGVEREALFTWVKSFYLNSEPQELSKFFIATPCRWFFIPRVGNRGDGYQSQGQTAGVITKSWDRDNAEQVRIYDFVRERPGYYFHLFGVPQFVYDFEHAVRGFTDQEVDLMIGHTDNPLERFEQEYRWKYRFKAFRDSDIYYFDYFTRFPWRVNEYYRWLIRHARMPMLLTSDLWMNVHLENERLYYRADGGRWHMLMGSVVRGDDLYLGVVKYKGAYKAVWLGVHD
jgi:hypothetical protein